MIVSAKPRVVFVPVGKTGSFSIYRWMLSRGAKLHWAYHAVDCRALREKLSKHFVFATVRNPFSRMVSLYDYVKGRKVNYMHRYAVNRTFPEFVQWHCGDDDLHVERVPTQAVQLAGFKINKLLRFETLAADFAALPFVKKGEGLRHFHRSRRKKDWRKYYDPKTIQIVSAWACDDFKRFGYKEAL